MFVRTFPEGDGPWQVSRSSERAVQPRWSPAGREVFYVVGDTLVAAEVFTEPVFSVGRRREVLRSEGLLGSFAPQYDVSRDGQRFVLLEPVAQEKPTLQVTLNWFEEFRGREQD